MLVSCSSSVVSAAWAPVEISGCAMSLYEPTGREIAVARSTSYSVKFHAETIVNRTCPMYVLGEGAVDLAAQNKSDSLCHQRTLAVVST